MKLYEIYILLLLLDNYFWKQVQGIFLETLEHSDSNFLRQSNQ